MGRTDGADCFECRVVGSTVCLGGSRDASESASVSSRAPPRRPR